MPTYGELSQQYARSIKSAASSAIQRKSAGLITEAEKRRRIIVSFQEVRSDLNKYDLTDSGRNSILRLTAQNLGLANTDSFVILVKRASIDNFVDLADYWDQFFAQLDE